MESKFELLVNGLKDLIQSVQSESPKAPSPSQIPKPKKFTKECNVGDVSLRQKLRRKGKTYDVALGLQKRENKIACDKLKYSQAKGVFITYLVHGALNTRHDPQYHLLRVPLNKVTDKPILTSLCSDKITEINAINLLKCKGAYICVNCNLGHKLFNVDCMNMNDEQDFDELPELIKEIENGSVSLEKALDFQQKWNSIALVYYNTNKYYASVVLVARHGKGIYTMQEDYNFYETNIYGEYNYYLVEIPLTKKNYAELVELLKRIQRCVSIDESITTLQFNDLTQLPKSWECRFPNDDIITSFLNPQFTCKQNNVFEFIDKLEQEKDLPELLNCDLSSIDLNSTVNSINDEYIDLGKNVNDSETKNVNDSERSLEDRVNEFNRNNKKSVQYIVTPEHYNKHKRYILQIPIRPNKYLIRRMIPANLEGPNRCYVYYKDLRGARLLKYVDNIYEAYKIYGTIAYQFLDSNQKIIDDINRELEEKYFN